MESLHKNRTWDLVKLPKGKKVVRCKWVFKKKEETPGIEEPRYKARLVAKGYSQISGADFTDMFSPVVKHSSIRALLSIVAMHDLELEQLSSTLSPQSDDEIEYMSHVSYSSAVGSLILEELKIESLGMLMLILLETLIEEDLSQVMSLQSEVVQSVGKPLCKLQSLCLPLKLSTWRLLRLVKKLFG
ncbi:hypothetical protein CXB51_008411 [Gossypium anomalum]|uniref:Reverse transcriptase Ty1/copia-type domain-containing protein n=1 Tax=Gossypium anomalum TaxID=47600 RepID=A0A8J5YWR4_9ROSI|nr:hypothetical protein CXB51_008411 [Gossypium anomalum]